jgi:hypothetical protein
MEPGLEVVRSLFVATAGRRVVVTLREGVKVTTITLTEEEAAALQAAIQNVINPPEE